MIVNTQASRAYVLYGTNGALSSISLANGELLHTMHIGGTLTDFALNENGSLLYLTGDCSTDNCADTLSVINTATYKTVATVAVNGSADTIAISPNGRLAFVTVARNTGTFLSVIDTINDQILSNIPIAPLQVAIAVSPRGAMVYLASGEGRPSKLQVVDVATGKVVASINQGNIDPSFLAANPNGNAVYESVYGAASPSTNLDLRVLNTRSNTLTLVAGTQEGQRGIAFSPNGRSAYVAEPSGIAVVDATTNKRSSSTIAVPGGSESIPGVLVINRNNDRLIYATSFSFTSTKGSFFSVNIPK